MLPVNTSSSYVAELLHNLQVHLVSSYFSHCHLKWREIDYIPTYNKFYWIVDGEGWLKIGEDEYYPKAGQLCLMPANVKQSYSVINDNTYRKYWCHFTATIGDLDLFQWLAVPHCLTIKHNQQQLHQFFKELTHLYEDDSLTARIREKAILLEIIAAFLNEAEPAMQFVANRTQDLDRLQSIEHFIQEHLAEPVTLEQIAKHVHLHPNYLVRYFNKHFAVSPLKYLNRKRMQKASALLSTTSLPVREIAEQVGFSDTNHFAKAFRKENSCSPTEYRLQVRKSL
ncbi:AraC family transcriptional regulator [Paenibacillus yanchengensis]|uniref:AraC family transcriptional regulator n=1 Tax=Paenibacillus yanchengensis TaxID=2035833 RepID=A0ABW4YHZ5_9BACL